MGAASSHRCFDSVDRERACVIQIVEAFFFLGAAVPGMGGVPPTSSQLRAMEEATRAAHAAFLTEYGLTAAKVPLLSLDLHQHTGRSAHAYHSRIIYELVIVIYQRQQTTAARPRLSSITFLSKS